MLYIQGNPSSLESSYSRQHGNTRFLIKNIPSADTSVTFNTSNLIIGGFRTKQVAGTIHSVSIVTYTENGVSHTPNVSFPLYGEDEITFFAHIIITNDLGAGYTDINLTADYEGTAGSSIIIPPVDVINPFSVFDINTVVTMISTLTQRIAISYRLFSANTGNTNCILIFDVVYQRPTTTIVDITLTEMINLFGGTISHTDNADSNILDIEVALYNNSIVNTKPLIKLKDTDVKTVEGFRKPCTMNIYKPSEWSGFDICLKLLSNDICISGNFDSSLGLAYNLQGNPFLKSFY